MSQAESAGLRKQKQPGTVHTLMCGWSEDQKRLRFTDHLPKEKQIPWSQEHHEMTHITFPATVQT